MELNIVFSTNKPCEIEILIQIMFPGFMESKPWMTCNIDCSRENV